MTSIPRLIRFLAATTLIFIAAFTLMRLGFWFYFRNPADPLPLDMLLKSFYLGFKFDLRLALLIILPVLLTGLSSPVKAKKVLKIWGVYLLVIAIMGALYLLKTGSGLDYLFGKWQKLAPVILLPLLLAILPRLNPIRYNFWRRFWVGYLSLAAIAVLLFYILDFGHYAYLNTRLDSTVLRFLQNPLISGQMVWESYPVLWITLGLMAASTFFIITTNKLIENYTCADYQPLPRWRKAGVVTLTLFLVLFGIYGKFSWYPLRWSDAFFGTHAFASSVASNPIIYFSYTFASGGQPYDEERVRELYPLMANYLDARPRDGKALNYSRRVTALGPARQHPNIIVVILESFASYKSGLAGNPLNPTPNFDAIAKDGIYFRNFFTPHTGTARSVFAFTTGIPDIKLGSTSTRNPAVVNQHTLINTFAGYEKFYFLGGSASWGNIRGLLGTNIDGLHIFEEGSYLSPRIDVWGISDLDLFQEANQVLKDAEPPFFAVVQTAGNHRPYTIPDDNGGFQKISPQEDVTRHGFHSVEEFNSYRFMDHSIGHFIRMAKKEGYFDNSIFVFFGDHGLDHDTGEHSLKQETQLGLGSYRVPFVIYAPKLLQGGRVEEKIASEVDVLTTLASLTGHDHLNTTFGRDLFNQSYDDERYAFTISHSSVPLIGLIGPEYYFRMRADGSDRKLFRLGTDNPREDFSKQYPEKAAEMERLTVGIHETAKYVMNHNKPPGTSN